MDNFQDKFEKIEQLLLEKRLQQAIDLLKELSSSEWVKQRIDEIQIVYRPMLDYALLGIEDKESSSILNNLIRKMFILTDDLRLEFQKNNTFFENKNRGLVHVDYVIEQIINKTENSSIKSLISEVFENENNKEKENLDLENLTKEIFYSILSSQRWEQKTFENFKQLLQNQAIPSSLKCVSISAFMLNLLSFFDENKILFLFQNWDKVENKTTYRIIIALILALNKYENRFVFFDSISQHIQKNSNNEKFVELAKISILQLIRTSETESITKKIKDEILPEMLKFSAKIKDKIDKGTIDIDDIEEQSSAWQEFFKENNLSDKIEEFSDLQREGADVYMSTFSNLKSYPFFNSACNWFLPFDTKHSSVCQLFEFDSEFLTILTQNPSMCNSDKYSFCLTLSQLPQNQWNTMIKNSKTETQQLKNDKDDKKLTNPFWEIEQETNQYVQDLYRFYKLFPAKMVYNPLDMILQLHTKQFIKTIFNEEILSVIADFYFAKKIYSAAFDLLNELTNKKNDIAYFKKIGYCAQQMQQWEQAIDFYNNVLIFDPQNKWTLKRLAFCAKKLKNWDKALYFYKEVEKIEPENLNIQQNIANCLFELKKYDEALSLFFKLEYFSPDNLNVQRAIVYCSIFCDKKEQSLKYGNKLLKKTLQFDDFILVGFCYFLQQNKSEAINLFQKGFLQIKSKEEFLSRFNEIGSIFQNFGIDTNKLNLLNEFLRLYFSEL